MNQFDNSGKTNTGNTTPWGKSSPDLSKLNNVSIQYKNPIPKEEFKNAQKEATTAAINIMTKSQTGGAKKTNNQKIKRFEAMLNNIKIISTKSAVV